MNAAETKRLRVKHVEAMRMLAESEDVCAHTEMIVAVRPLSLLARASHGLARMARAMARAMEEDARLDARRTYQREE